MLVVEVENRRISNIFKLYLLLEKKNILVSLCFNMNHHCQNYQRFYFNDK